MDFSGFHNGRPCKACTSAEEMIALGKKMAAKKAAQHDEQPPPDLVSKSSDVGGSSTSQVPPESALTQPAQRRPDCPVDKDELGRSTWNLLHTMSVYYPDEPTSAERSEMRTMLDSLAKTYPCPPCAEDLRRDLQTNPPNLTNRDVFAKWMCEMHNRVNVKLDKEKFDCGLVMERWYDGWKDGSCDY